MNKCIGQNGVTTIENVFKPQLRVNSVDTSLCEMSSALVFHANSSAFTPCIHMFHTIQTVKTVSFSCQMQMSVCSLTPLGKFIFSYAVFLSHCN